jgi:hypothetical protein
VLSIGDRAKTLEIVATVKQNFPEVTILARAHSRQEAYELLDAGVAHVYRESLDTSLRLGVDALRMLGFRATQAHHAARTFHRHDERNVREQAATQGDKTYFDRAAKAVHDLEDLLLRELDARDGEGGDIAWDSESLRQEFGRKP